VDRFFLNPWALALAGLSGAIILLYILKLRRVRVRISSTLLWEKEVRDFKANAPWQRLRRNLLMILQIIALLLLALALARPFIFGTALSGGRSVVIIDTSASMLATDEKPDRLGRALKEASTLIGDMSRNDEAMVIAAGPAPRVLCSFSQNKTELLAAVSRAREGAGGVADLNAALRLVSSVAAGTATRAVIFSDGAVPDLDPFATTDLKLSYYPLGKGGDNIGITSASARRNQLTQQYELFVAVQNFYSTPQTADLTLYIGDDPLDVRELQLSPGQRSEVLFSGLPYQQLPLKVSLEHDDELQADNTAFALLPSPRKYNVAFCSAGESLLLRKALGSLPQSKLYGYDGSKLSGAPAIKLEEVDVWVVEGDAPCAANPTANYLFIDSTRSALLPVVPGAEVKLDFNADPPVVPTVIGADRSHPLLRFVNISDLRLQAMRRCKLQPWGRAVVDASEGPLIVEGRDEGQLVLYLAFNIYDSDFPLRAAFPIFLANVVEYLGSARSASQGLTATAGQRVDLLAPLEAQAVEVQAPDGRQQTIELGSRDFTLSDTSASGLYTLTYKDEQGQSVGEQLLPVSLLSPEESNIAPAAAIRIQGTQEALAAGSESAQQIAGSRTLRVNREFYTWLILLVLLILCAEWYLYHTRAL
jgi:Ca-activated chloride channel homolog